jgi:hypothetical protein
MRLPSRQWHRSKELEDLSTVPPATRRTSKVREALRRGVTAEKGGRRRHEARQNGNDAADEVRSDRVEDVPFVDHVVNASASVNASE